MRRFDELSTVEKQMYEQIRQLKDKASDIGNENLEFHLDVALKFLRLNDDEGYQTQILH